jgi:hypothetical protein
MWTIYIIGKGLWDALEAKFDVFYAYSELYIMEL